MKQIRYTPGTLAEVTSRITAASINVESGGCCIYLGRERVDCTLDQIEDEIPGFVAALERIAARKLKGDVEPAA